MSTRIVARRDLMRAAARLAKTNAPLLEDYKAVAAALSAVMTADTGIEMKLSVRIRTDRPATTKEKTT